MKNVWRMACVKIDNNRLHRPIWSLSIILFVFLAYAVSGGNSMAAAPALVTTSGDSQTAYTLFHPLFHKGEEVVSTLYIQPENEEPVTFSIAFYGADGNVVFTVQDSFTGPERWSLASDGDMLNGLPDGEFSIVMSSTVVIHSIVRLFDPVSRGFALYPGIDGSEFGNSAWLYFGPFYHQTDFDSTLRLMNIGTNAIDIAVEFTTPTGTTIASRVWRNISPHAQMMVTKEDLAALLPSNFKGWVRVAVSGPTTGLLTQHDSFGKLIGAWLPLTTRTIADDGSAASLAYEATLPRVLDGLDQAGGERHTELFVANIGDSAMDFQVTASSNRGGTYASYGNPEEIPPLGADFIDPGEMSTPMGQTGAGPIWAARAFSEQPFVLGEITSYPSLVDPTDYVSAAYSSWPSNIQYLPRIVRNQKSHSIIQIQNVGADQTDVSVRFMGSSVEQPLILNSLGWGSLNLSAISGFGNGFDGGAIVLATQPIQVIVDEYVSVADTSFPANGCAAISEIPQAECETLVVLFDETDGENWIQNTDWLQTNTPCSWYGVHCKNGHVVQHLPLREWAVWSASN